MDIDSLQRHWQIRSAVLLQRMATRIELTFTWHELDALLTDSLTVTTRPDGIWRCRPVPAARGLARPLRQTAINALTVAAGSAHDRGTSQHVFDSRNVVDAKRIVRNALYTYALDSCGAVS